MQPTICISQTRTTTSSARSRPPASSRLLAGTGQRGFSGDGGNPATAQLNSPGGVAVGPSGNIYIADTGNGRVRRVVPANAFGPATISTVPNPNSIWRAPTGIAVDPAGNVFIADRDDQRVFKIEPNTRLTVVAGTGAAGFSGESGTALEMPLANPTGLIVDANGIIYLCDTDNHRIRTLTPHLGDVVPPPALKTMTVVNAASMLPGLVAPGEIISLFGDGIGPEDALSADLSSLTAPVELGGVQVLVSGHQAPLFYAGPDQINLEVPYSLAGHDAAEIQVVAQGTILASAIVQIAPAAPGIFTTGTAGQAAALNEDTVRELARESGRSRIRSSCFLRPARASPIRQRSKVRRRHGLLPPSLCRSASGLGTTPPNSNMRSRRPG